MNDSSTITKEALTWLLEDEDERARIVLVDVREPEEFERGHIENAISIPLGRIENEIALRVPNKRARVIVYCAKGTRSNAAQLKLAALAYRRTVSLVEGYDGWIEARATSSLSAVERLRYARQTALPSLGLEGQEALRQARVLVVGAGGLGSPVALYLAAAGVGTLGIVDSDHVELSNLHRQVLHTTPRVGLPKVESAKKALAQLNPHVNVVPHAFRFEADGSAAFASEYDLLIDGSDNFATRYAISDAGCAAGVPIVHGSVHRLEGQLAVFLPKRAAHKRGVAAGPCYRCIFPQPPTSAPNCETAGVLGSVCGVIGSLMATEALKLLSSIAPSNHQKLVLYDAIACELRSIAVTRRVDCICNAI